MTINHKLIEAIKARGRRSWGGMRTADEYVKTITDVVGGNLLSDDSGLSQGELEAMVKSAAGKLTFNDDTMVVEQSSGLAEVKGKVDLPEGVELPPNTLMVFRHVITSNRKDRDGDVLRPEGATIDPKMLLLWQHIPTLPIGKMLGIAERNSKIIKLVTAIIDMNTLSHDAAVMIENEMGRFSHGFAAHEFSELKEEEVQAGGPPGFDVKLWDMYEESIVSIPSNVDAEQEDILLSLVGKQKLKSPIITTFAKSLQDKRPLSVPAPEMPKESKVQDTEQVVAAVPMRKLFDLDSEHVEPSKIEYDWAARFLGCSVKDIYVDRTCGGGPSRGSMMQALATMTDSWDQKDLRNLNNDGTEEPPQYENIQLNSTTRRTFLVEGIRFYEAKNADGQPFKICIKTFETWSGQQVVVYTDVRHVEEANKLIDNVWEWVDQNHMLKGEAFSLTGEFIARTGTKWNELFLPKETESVLHRTTRLINEKGKSVTNRGIILMGPPGCLHADTPIYDPVTGMTATVKQREIAKQPFHVYALNEDGCPVIAKAERPWRYDPSEMVRLSFESGRQVTVTLGHRFWDGSDYVSAQQICERHQQCGDIRLPSSSAESLKAQTQGGRHSTQTIQDPQGCCSEGLCLCDEQPHLAVAVDQSELPLPADAQRHIHAELHEDDQVASGSDSGQAWSLHHSKREFDHHSAARSGCGVQADADSGICEPSYGGTASSGQSRRQSHLDRTFEGTAEFAGLSTLERASQSHSAVGPPDHILWDRVVEVERVGRHAYYDFHVPQYENYWAGGMFHHNTGKTLSGRVMLNEAKSTFIWVSAKDFWRTGCIGGLVRGFELARKLGPAILFVEDVDNWLGDHAIDVIKTEMDGISRSSGVVTMLTTNYPERLPKALIDRPGRFHDVLNIDLPSKDVRRKMIQAWVPDVDNLTAEKIADKTDGYSGAHIYELAYFAETLREDEEMSVNDSLEKAIEKIEKQRSEIDAHQLQGSTYKHEKSDAPSRVTFCKESDAQRVTSVVGWDKTKSRDYDQRLEALYERRPDLDPAINKSGRVLSKRNLEALIDVKEDVMAINEMEVPRAAKAMCKDCIGKLTKVIDDATPAKEDPEDESKPAEKPVEEEKVITDKQAAAIVMLSDDEQLIQQVRDSLDAVLKSIESERVGEEFRTLVAS